jgi:FkbM family methyltransferase
LRFNFERVDFIPLLLYYTGVFEPRLLAYLRAILKPGDTVLDVGANIGFHTLESWKAVGRSGRVISVEASADHVESVRRNLRANDFPIDDVINLAVGDRDGEVTLGLPPGGNSGMFGINAGNESAFAVRLQKLDDLLASRSLTDLALIKIDIEGSELGALRGAAETLSRYRPPILIELNETALRRCGASAAEVVSFCGNLDYEGWIISPAGVRRIVPGMAHDCDECLFLPNSADELRARLRLPD